jgi:hypothetical protein
MKNFFRSFFRNAKKRKRLGVITTRWIQTREHNEALDLVCMILCALETYRGTLGTMEPQIVTSEKEQAIKWGA